MRMFVAIRPPDGALAELAAVAAPVRRNAPKALRWTNPDQWHVTLTFLGDVPEEAVTGLATGLDAAATMSPPLPLRLAGSGRFGDRVLWAGLRDGRFSGAAAVDGAVLAVLARLAADITNAAAGAGIRMDDKPFRPHLTLARAGGRVRPRLDLRPLAADLAPFEGGPWMASEIHLIHSTLGMGPDGGAIHRELASWPLGGSTSGARPQARPHARGG